MRSFKIAAFSGLLLLGAAGALWAFKTGQETGVLYQQFAAQIKGAQKGQIALTQVKQDVNRAYWFLNKREKLVIHVSYPASQVFREQGLVEEMFDLSAESIQGLSKNTLTAHKGRLDYEKNLLIMEEAHLESFKRKGRLCEAYAQDVALDLKSSSPTFVARDIRAEVSR